MSFSANFDEMISLGGLLTTKFLPLHSFIVGLNFIDHISVVSYFYCHEVIGVISVRQFVSMISDIMLLLSCLGLDKSVLELLYKKK